MNRTELFDDEIIKNNNNTIEKVLAARCDYEFIRTEEYYNKALLIDGVYYGIMDECIYELNVRTMNLEKIVIFYYSQSTLKTIIIDADVVDYHDMTDNADEFILKDATKWRDPEYCSDRYSTLITKTLEEEKYNDYSGTYC